jgi:hypothetical protein
MFIDIILLCNHVLALTSGTIRSSREKFRRVCLYTRKRLPRSGFVQTGFWEGSKDDEDSGHSFLRRDVS